MKTILQIVQELIEKQAALASQPDRYHARAHEALERMQKRFDQAPALIMLTTHYAKALLIVLPMLPIEMRTSTIQSVMAQVIQGWEDIHREFESQLRSSANAD